MTVTKYFTVELNIVKVIYAIYIKMFYFYFSPTYSTAKLMDKTGLTLKDIDVFEFHEAFAVSYILGYFIYLILCIDFF